MFSYKDLILSSSNQGLIGIKKGLISLVNQPNYYIRECLKIIKSILTPVPKYPVVRKINNTINFIYDFQLDPQIRQMYAGIYQSEILNVMKKNLIQGDIFIDVGASIGYMSAFCASLVGKRGEVHLFEPVPSYFDKLSKWVNLNKGYKFFLNNFALGESQGIAQIKISDLQNLGWNTMVPGWMKPHTIKKTLEVNVIRLDDYIFENNIKEISLIKIDVEGYEYPVLKGLTKFFSGTEKKLPLIIIEISPTACFQLGYKMRDLEFFMSKYHYKSFTLSGFRIDLKKLENTTDILFKQDL